MSRRLSGGFLCTSQPVRTFTTGCPGLALAVVVSALVFPSSRLRADDLPRAISDREFWRILTEFSEADGRFQREYMSNEDSAQFVIPALKKIDRPGGVYVGVGPEQNFTYLAVLQPQIAFVIDIRRDNMIRFAWPVPMR